jgi:hypothetical protein
MNYKLRDDKGYGAPEKPYVPNSLLSGRSTQDRPCVGNSLFTFHSSTFTIRNFLLIIFLVARH